MAGGSMVNSHFLDIMKWLGAPNPNTNPPKKHPNQCFQPSTRPARKWVRFLQRSYTAKKLPGGSSSWFSRTGIFCVEVLDCTIPNDWLFQDCRRVRKQGCTSVSYVVCSRWSAANQPPKMQAWRVHIRWRFVTGILEGLETSDRRSNLLTQLNAIHWEQSWKPTVVAWLADAFFAGVLAPFLKANISFTAVLCRFQKRYNHPLRVDTPYVKGWETKMACWKDRFGLLGRRCSILFLGMA